MFIIIINKYLKEKLNEKLFIFLIIPITLLITNCTMISSNYIKPYITVVDQYELKLGMNEEQVQKLLGYPLEISLGQDSTRSTTIAFWTYYLRYPVIYPGTSPAGNSNVSIGGKPRVNDQMLKGNLMSSFAEEQKHKLVFVDGKLVAFGNEGEISSLSLFSIKPLINGLK